MRTKEQLDDELAASLSAADTLYDKNITEAIAKHEKLLSYYSSLQASMKASAQKKYDEATKKLLSRATPSFKPSGKRGRPSKLDLEIEAAKQRQRDMLYNKTQPPLTRQQIQEEEEKKREEIRAANISTVFSAFGFVDEREEEGPAADELNSEDERELAAINAAREAKRKEKEALPPPPAPPPSIEPELTEAERAKLRQESMEADRKTLTTDKHTVVRISNVQNLIIQAEQPIPSNTPPPKAKKPMKKVLIREPMKSVGSANTYRVPTSRSLSSWEQDEEADSDGTP